MPGTSYGLPAVACKTGAKLATVAGTICASCYALAGAAKYQMPRAAVGQRKRLEAINRPAWVDAITALLLHEHGKSRIKIDLGIAGVRLQRAGGQRYRYNEPGWHRWHDSGDLQSVYHLYRICEVARRTPQIRHWLPTQEMGMVRRYIAGGGTVPGNLLIRVSSVRVDDAVKRAWPYGATVFTSAPPAGAHRCPAPTQGHRCMSCRACWSFDVPFVAYEAH